MSKEIPLQQDMFTHALVDTRTRTQKSRDRTSQQHQQASMFSARETVQLGVNPRPWLKDMAQPTLILEIQDVRTEEEKEQERRHMAEALTVPLFAGDEGLPEETSAVVIGAVYEAPNLRQVGFRAYVRRRSIPVRQREEI
jgi:hypothetical protein